MLKIAGARQSISQCLPNLWITRIFLNQLSEIGKNLPGHPAMSNQMSVGMKSAGDIPARNIASCCEQERVSTIRVGKFMRRCNFRVMDGC